MNISFVRSEVAYKTDFIVTLWSVHKRLKVRLWSGCIFWTRLVTGSYQPNDWRHISDSGLLTLRQNEKKIGVLLDWERRAKSKEFACIGNRTDCLLCQSFAEWHVCNQNLSSTFPSCQENLFHSRKKKKRKKPAGKGSICFTMSYSCRVVSFFHLSILLSSDGGYRCTAAAVALIAAQIMWHERVWSMSPADQVCDRLGGAGLCLHDAGSLIRVQVTSLSLPLCFPFRPFQQTYSAVKLLSLSSISFTGSISLSRLSLSLSPSLPTRCM